MDHRTKANSGSNAKLVADIEEHMIYLMSEFREEHGLHYLSEHLDIGTVAI